MVYLQIIYYQHLTKKLYFTFIQKTDNAMHMSRKNPQIPKAASYPNRYL
jgi:hypothetical protein